MKAYDATLSAHVRFGAGQIVAALLLLAAAFALRAEATQVLSVVLSIGFCTIFGSSIALRLAAAAKRSRLRELPIADRDLPVYSIVVALYREAHMIDQLVAALDAIHYPRAKLDVKIVLEKDDEETLLALARQRLPVRYDLIVAPPGAPRTKPRALNVALPFLRGRYVVVFDAEDLPAPDQLRRAAAHFAAEPDIGCLQARLVIDAPENSWLAGMFAIEYSALFGAINPGLASMGAPIALGGSSNHLRTDVLRRVGGWDAWNVTEDADLGLRLARFGVRVATFDSETCEEAPASFVQWLAQRRRWHKGWLQTALVHSRDPLRVARELGALGAWRAASLMAGAIFGAMFGPLFTLHALWRCIFGDLLSPQTPFQWATCLMTFGVLLSGSMAIMAPAIIGLRRGGRNRLIWGTPLLPFYYCLVSLAAWLAVYDLIRDPFYWFKTEHGARRAPAPITTGRDATLGD